MIYAGKFIVKYVINTDPEKMTKRIASVIRNALYMTQTLHIICSPRESKHNLSTVFLSEVCNHDLIYCQGQLRGVGAYIIPLPAGSK